MRDYQLILCVFESVELQGKIRKLIPKGRSACNNICLGISWWPHFDLINSEIVFSDLLQAVRRGVRKKTEPLGEVRKKAEILGGTKILVGMEKNYFYHCCH